MIRTHHLHDRTPMADAPLALAFQLPEEGAVWVDIESPTAEDIELLAKRFQFHPLAVEDCIHPQKRSKFERYPTHSFVVIQALDRSTPDDPLDTVGIEVFIRPKLVVTVRSQPLTAIDAVTKALSDYPERVGTTAERLLHALLDAVIDETTAMLFLFEEQVDELERRRPDPKRKGPVEELIRLRRDLLTLRRITLPQREVIRRFVDADNTDISAEGRMYFRDVLDHVEFISDETQLLLDVCNGSIQLHVNAANDRLNQVMKYLAVVSTLLLPMTIISGAFGMNVVDIPFAEHPHAFWVVVGVMLACVFGLLAIFRARRWF
ncbi:MAG: magnesium/cobalt transporter CorA [Myxococcota bacterium]